MAELYNVYCDESCHLENDGQKAMVLGALSCPADKRREVSLRIREIKARHGISSKAEAKWTKISPSRVKFYTDLVDFFFDDSDLSFRALVVPDKDLLNHKAFDQSHDLWYYKMYFDMLKAILNPHDHYHIYIDIKDTLGDRKVKKLHNVLSNNQYDFSRNVIQRVQQIHSREVELMEPLDVLIGAVSYANRYLSSSKAKVAVVDRIRKRSGYSLTESTLLRERKMNIFCWRATEAG
jgi:hypothetical protein